MHDWQIAFIIPNIKVPRSFESKYISIVPNDDLRISNIIKKNREIGQFIHSFTDSIGRKRDISLVIFRNDIPAYLRRPEAISSFRNILAISSIVKSILGRPIEGTRYSDFFAFYPVIVSKDGALLLIFNPSQTGMISPKAIVQALINPGLPKVDFDYDRVLSRFLLEKWVECFEERNELFENTALFRSLEVAYHACSMPIDNLQSLYDYGLKMSLWVSAFEVLVHPKYSCSSKDFVIKYLENYKFNTAVLNHKRYRYGKKRNIKWTTFHGILYFHLNEARNYFLHGNEISDSVLAYIRKGHEKISVFSTAILLYSISLVVRLNINTQNLQSSEFIDFFYGINQLEDFILELHQK